MSGIYSKIDAHPVALVAELDDSYHARWRDWDAATLWRELEARGPIPTASKQKIQAAKTILLSPLPYTDWFTFEKIVLGLHGIIPQFDVLQAPPVRYMLGGAQMMQQIKSDTFSEDVLKYAAAVFMLNQTPPAPPLEGAKQFVFEKATPRGTLIQLDALQFLKDLDAVRSLQLGAL